METLKDLLLRARVGDLAAYEEIVRRYQDMAVGYAFSVLGDFHLAEDAAQEAFVEAYRCLSRLREPLAFAAWLRRIVFKHCDRLTRRRDAEFRPHEIMAEAPSNRQGMLEHIEEAEEHAMIHEAIWMLPETERTAIVLFYFSELSHREIAAFLELPQTQVNNVLRRAKKRLLERMLKMARKEKAPSRSDALVGKVMLALRSFAGNYERVALSPDGKLVAFTVKSSDWQPTTTGELRFLPNGVPYHAGGAEIWVTDIEGAHLRVLTPDWGSSWGPSWSPDGRKLAFYSDKNGEPQVWIWHRERGDMQLAGEAPVCAMLGTDRLMWLPDEKRLVAKLRAENWTPPSGQPEPVRQSCEVWISPRGKMPERPAEEAGWRWYDAYRGDLAVMDVESGETNLLGKDVIVLGMALSPDGRYVAVKCLAGNPSEGDGNTVKNDLRVFAVDGSEDRVLARDFPQAHGLPGFSWSPDSGAIAYATNEKNGGQLMLAFLDGTQKMLDTGDVDPGNEEGAPPLWSSSGRTIYFWAGMSIYAVSLDGKGVKKLTENLGDRSVYGMFHSSGSGTANSFGQPESIVVITRHRKTKCEGLFRVGQGEPVAIVPEANRTLLKLFLVGDCTDRWIVGPVEDATRPPDLYRIDIHARQERCLIPLNPEMARAVPVPVKLLSFTGPDGRSLLSSLFLPSDYEPGNRYPAIVHLYYGAFQSGRPMNAFVDINARLTEAGYAVLWPDMPVSGPNPAETIAALAEGAIEAAIKEGYAHPRRTGLMGHSMGGYSTCCAIAHTHRFQAAVAVAPFTDLVSFALHVVDCDLNWARWVEGGSLNLRATVWEDRQKYIDNSPVFHLDRVETPILLIHGTDDGLISQSEEMFAGLLRLGKTAALARYHGEGHVPREWSVENYQDYWRRIIGWFDHYLQEKSP